jgi:hypothetical protein
MVYKRVGEETGQTFTKYLGESLLCDLEPCSTETRLINFAPRLLLSALARRPATIATTMRPKYIQNNLHDIGTWISFPVRIEILVLIGYSEYKHQAEFRRSNDPKALRRLLSLSNRPRQHGVLKYPHANSENATKARKMRAGVDSMRAKGGHDSKRAAASTQLDSMREI